MLTDEEIQRRKPVWTALSELWLDIELDDRSLSYIAKIMHESGYSIEELKQIYLHEVAPVVYGNMLTVTGAWSGFDQDWLHDEIVRALSKRGRFAAWRLKQMRGLMTYATEEHWNTLVVMVETLRGETRNTG